MLLFFLLAFLPLFLVACRNAGYGDFDSANAEIAGNGVIKGKVTRAVAGASVKTPINAATRLLDDANVWVEELPQLCTKTKADGTFLISGVPEGTFRIVSSYSENITVFKMRSPGKAVPRDGVVEVNLSLAEAKNIVRGVLFDANGQVLPVGTPISLWGEVFYIRENGRFETPPLPAMEGTEAINDIFINRGTASEFAIPVSFVSRDNPLEVEISVPGTTGTMEQLPKVTLLALSNGTIQNTASRNGQLVIHAYVVPTDAAESSITWSVTRGSLSDATIAEGNRRQKTWTAPDSRGLATVTVTLTTTSGKTATASLPLLVERADPEVVTYSVNYAGNGSTGGTVPTDAVTYANDVIVTVLGNTGNLVKTGYTFAGWNTKADGTGTDYAANATFAMGSANVSLYAKWTVVYNTTYENLQTGSEDTNPSTYTVADLPIALVSGTNDAWAFVGWYDNSSFAGAPVTEFPLGTTGNKTLYAKWKMDLFEGKPGHTDPTKFGRRIAFNTTTGYCYVLDGTTVKYWNKTEWKSLPTTGMPTVTPNYGAAIAVDNQNNQNVYYLTESSTSGVVGTYCTKWDGTSWTNLGNQGFGSAVAIQGGVPGTPQIAISADGTVYALTHSAVNSTTIYRLTAGAGTWQDITPPDDLYCGALCIDGNTVYTVGFIFQSDTDLRVSSWNGAAWSTVGDAPVTTAAAWGKVIYLAAQAGNVVVGFADKTTTQITVVRKVPGSNTWTSLGTPTSASNALVNQGTTGIFDLGIYNQYPVVFTRDSRIIKHNGTAWQEVSQSTTAGGGAVFGAIDQTNGVAWMYMGNPRTIPGPPQYVKKQNLN